MISAFPSSIVVGQPVLHTQTHFVMPVISSPLSTYKAVECKHTCVISTIDIAFHKLSDQQCHTSQRFVYS